MKQCKQFRSGYYFLEFWLYSYNYPLEIVRDGAFSDGKVML